ncbi:hypothetical protein AHIS1636_00110 [Arthrobacter mangrovi]|uniref:Uncharacterized protein n=1 Tax=Arthrobacter mangrovi TaxID=2966350 RepID=A0ABQ5MNJ5_9MICC|nr:hypothetical protein AHIS1636_00110 [Arthrobacter mangrovi]
MLSNHSHPQQPPSMPPGLPPVLLPVGGRVQASPEKPAQRPGSSRLPRGIRFLAAMAPSTPGARDGAIGRFQEDRLFHSARRLGRAVSRMSGRPRECAPRAGSTRNTPGGRERQTAAAAACSGIAEIAARWQPSTRTAGQLPRNYRKQQAGPPVSSAGSSAWIRGRQTVRRVFLTTTAGGEHL